MSTQLAAVKQQDANASLYESLALKGDLSNLKPEEKAKYYSALCERLGLDPATQPFTPLKLNGKEILYATKGATDQLARLHNVNRQIVDEKELRGVYIVTVEATLPNGRKEQSKGAVNVENLKGDAFCNAIMKAETKAKRRATLSILGLGMLDESEMETIPEYARVTKTELIEAARSEPVIEPQPETISISALCKELIAAGDDIQWNAETLKEYAEQLFDIDVVDLVELDESQKQWLAEDLTARLNSLNAAK